jgi:DivIVA domain-containing protein
MARLLPIDLVNAQFPKASFGGYKHEEVNDLIDRAAHALEDLAGGPSAGGARPAT